MATDIAGTNLIGGAGNWLLTAISTIFKVLAVAVIAAAAFFIGRMILRYLKYNIDVEFWENKGGTLSYVNDDKARRNHKKGVTYITFLKSKGDMYAERQMPDPMFLIKKRLFGSKIKYVISGDELIPIKSFTLSNANEVVAEALPTHQKIDYYQRLEAYEKRYANQKWTNAQKMALAISVGLIGIIVFGLFVIWQSNVANSEAIGNGINSLTVAVENMAKAGNVGAGV